MDGCFYWILATDFFPEAPLTVLRATTLCAFLSVGLAGGCSKQACQAIEQCGSLPLVENAEQPGLQYRAMEIRREIERFQPLRRVSKKIPAKRSIPMFKPIQAFPVGEFLYESIEQGKIDAV